MHSQSAILVSNQDSEFSRIRNYKENVDITFSFMLDTLSFNYVDRGTMTTHSIRIPSTFDIFDFVVFHDSVFFCGRDFYLGPMYGYFGIQDAFFSNGYVYFFTPDIPTPFLNKIDVTTTRSGKTHMLMTGWNYLFGKGYNRFDNDSVNNFNKDKVSSQYGIILEAWETSPSSNENRYIIDSNFYYDDVASTDNYAVVTARKSNNPTTHDFFYYNSPIPPTASFLESWTTPAPSISNTPMMTTSPMTSIGEILVRKMQKDTFATACNNESTWDVTISIYPDPTQQSIKRFKIPGVSVSDEFVYSNFHRSFYMMAISLPFTAFCYTQFPFTTSTTLMEYVSNYRRLSLDITDNGKCAILSGREGISFSVAPKHFWLFDEKNINSCFPKNGVTNIGVNRADSPGTYLQDLKADTIYLNKVLVKSTIYHLEIECQ